MKIGIFTSFRGDLEKHAVKACKTLGVDYELVDITSSEWIKNVQQSDADGFFCPSTTLSQELKTILDERYYFVSQVMHRPIYPDYTGHFIHESKRNMAAWLEINGYPHAKTRVFTNKKEALDYIEHCNYPIVSKANVGAGASKVIVIKNKAKAKKMAQKCFNRRFFPHLFKGFVYKKRNIVFGVKLNMPDIRHDQVDYLIIQDFVKDVIHEWRLLKIGNSYFGHQKLLKNGFASGSGLVGWVEPPKELLLMIHDICEKGGFKCMDVDVFETKDGHYYINELQSSFGSYLDYQMCINGHHGRFLYQNGDFIFEEGDFNTHHSCTLKIAHFIEILNDKAKQENNLE